MTAYDDGVAAERARVLQIISRNGSDQRALQIALNCSGPRPRLPVDLPVIADDYARGVQEENYRIVRLLQMSAATQDPAGVVSAITSGAAL
jgi:hypothetical protein